MDFLPHSNDSASYFLLLVLFVVGRGMVADSPALRRAGKRIAAATFIVSSLYRGMMLGPESSDDWFESVLQALLDAGLALGISWIALASLAFGYGQTLRRLFSAVSRTSTWARRQFLRGRERRRERRRQHEARAAYEQAAPDRERARQQAQADLETKAQSQQRRIDARAVALLSFSFYRAKLGKRFSRAMFDQYIKDFMGNEHSAEVVEQRLRELQAIFERHLADVEPIKPAMTIEAITQWYQTQKEQLGALAGDEEAREVYEGILEEYFDGLIRKRLETLEP